MMRTCSRLGMTFLLVLILGLNSAASALATDWFDPAFGDNGRVTTDFANGEDALGSLALQADGKIVAVGRVTPAGSSWPNSFGIARYLDDGTLDPTFGQGGTSITPIASNFAWANANAIQTDGAIVVGGTEGANWSGDFALARYRPDGLLDATFGKGGIVDTDFGPEHHSLQDLALQPDRRIVAVGYAGTYSPNPTGASNPESLPRGLQEQFEVRRYNSDGSLDTSFGAGGRVVTDADPAGPNQAVSVVILPDGKILVGGIVTAQYSHSCLVRYNPDGSLDATFGGQGVVCPDVGFANAMSDMALQPDGKIVLAARLLPEHDGVVRVRADGSVDESFGDKGHVFTPMNLNGAYDLALQRDGKILVSVADWNGCPYQPGLGAGCGALLRYTRDGKLDASFGDAGVMSTYSRDGAFKVALDRQDRPVLGGTSFSTVQFDRDFVVFRFVNADPPLRSTWLPLLGR